MDFIHAAIVAGLGLCLGSFATALSYRLPRDISIVKKVRSACPACGHNLGFRDLFPVFSYLFLRGKCRYCRAPIGLRYLVIELATLALCLAVFALFGFSIEMLPLYFLMPVLVSIIDIDLAHKIIPDILNAAIAILGLFSPLVGWMDGLLGAFIYGLFAFLLRQIFMWLMKREPMGLGDVKFFAAVGLWLGAYNVYAAVFFLFFSGFFGILLGLLWKKWHAEAEFPFGPALVTSFIAALLSYGWQV